MRFTWDPRKATSNLRKHLVTFEEAATVFDDERALVQPDLAHEDRLLILGISAPATRHHYCARSISAVRSHATIMLQHASTTASLLRPSRGAVHGQ